MKPVQSVVLAIVISGMCVFGGAAVAAQDDAPSPEPESETGMATIVVGGWEIDYDTREPFIAHPISRTTNTNGSFVVWFATALTPSGDPVGLTPCDDIAVICQPIVSPAKAALSLADAGDTFALAGENS